MLDTSNSTTAAPTSSGGMGSKRFKLIMRYKQQANELAKVEQEMHKLAKNLALTSDCLNEANERQVFLVSETATLIRKAEKARL